MNLKELKRHWNGFGKTDPLWAILTLPDKQHGRWQLDEFFCTGETEVAKIMDYVRSLGVDPGRSRALDFGCGVGRLTQPLANYFEEVCGVDIAPSMILLAKKYNRHSWRCRFYLNDRADLRLFDDGTFNFIYSILTLQHIEPAYTKAYLREFLRLLVPGGVLVFNMPSERISVPESQSESGSASATRAPDAQPQISLQESKTESTGAKEDKNLFAKIKQSAKSVTPQRILYFYHRLKHPEPPRMEIHALKREELEGFLEQNGAQIVDVVRRDAAGPEWIGYRYCVRRN